MRVAGPGYLATMGIPVLRGRDIGPADTAEAPLVVVVNQTLARDLWPGQDALGRRVIFVAGVSAPVVGVVRDIRQEGLDSARSPSSTYRHCRQASTRARWRFIGGRAIEHRRGGPAGGVSVDPEQPVMDVLTMDQILEQRGIATAPSGDATHSVCLSGTSARGNRTVRRLSVRSG